MKYLNKISVLLSLLAVVLFASCDTDQEGAIYNEKGYGLTFSAGTLLKVAVEPSNPTFTVELYRGNAAEACSGQLALSATIGKNELAGCTVSDYSFAPGESKTAVTVNVEPLPVGYNLTVTLSIPDEANIAIGGVGTTKLTVQKEYNWTSLGTGTYTDNWGWGITYNVEILKAEGFDRYRVVEPYTESMKNDDGAWEDWLAPSACPYAEFYTVSENGTVSFDPFFLGLYYQADTSQPIYAYPADAFSGIDGSHSKWIDSKTIQLAPYYYIDGVGGWNMTGQDGVVLITLP